MSSSLPSAHDHEPAHGPLAGAPWWQLLGPGLLMAGAGIGVSHLVQSTRAGADFGWQLLPVILLVNVLKYPFFEYGHRYTAATGRTLLEGYREMGRFALWLFFGLNLITAVISIAGVTMVCAGLGAYILGGGFDIGWVSAVLLGLCMTLIIVGRYGLLEGAIHYIMAVLVIATAAALVMAVWHGPVAAPEFVAPDAYSWMAVGFIIALMGWMPAPIELSVWQSCWLKERQQRQAVSFREALFDFRFGYALMICTAAAFLALGALVLHGSGTEIAQGGIGFSAQLVGVYTQLLGPTAHWIIAVAAFATMFSTVLTVVDAYPRSLAETTQVLFPRLRTPGRWYHAAWMIGGGIVGLIIIFQFRAQMVTLVSLAATIAFLAAPVFAWLNYRVMRSDRVPAQHRPTPWLIALSLVGLVFLAGFSLLYLGWYITR